MPKCRFCNHDNPAGIDRCQNCGSWLEQVIPSDLSRQEPKTAADDLVPPQPDSFEGRILLLMQAGKKIEAIKIYRQETGSGLKKPRMRSSICCGTTNRAKNRRIGANQRPRSEQP